MIRGTKDLSEQIYSISIQQKNFIHDRLKQIGLNEMQARAINYISTFPGHIQKDLAIYLGKQDATVTNLLKQLEKLKYIRREIPNNNERQKLLFITQDGLEKVNEIQVIFVELEEKMNSDFNKEELQIFKDFLNKLNQTMMD